MSHLGVLKQTDIFSELSTGHLELISSICEERPYGMGDIIFEENSTSDELYVVAAGEVDIMIDPALVSDRPDPASRPSTIATMRRGQSFGEIALVDQGYRSASARSATHNTQLLIIPRQQLMMLCESDPVLGYHLMKSLAADLAIKLRNTDLTVREQLLYSRSGRSDPV